MRCEVRFAICLSGLLLGALLVLKGHIEDICNQYSAGRYFLDSVKLHHVQPNTSHPVGSHVKPGDKVIVMARLEEEKTSWVHEELPDWQNAIYIVNPSQTSLDDPSTLHTPMNKGHESMAYLTYIIDNYQSLPSIVAFLHSHRSGFFQAWHVDAPFHDNVIAMRSLQLDYVQQSGYVNLRCNWNPGCKKAHRRNKHITENVWEEVFNGTSTLPITQYNPNGLSPSSSPPTQQVFRFPYEVGAACCAQFAVSREQVLKRPLEDYIQFRNFIIRTSRDDATSGRIMEFLWHIIFGQNAVNCPDENECYCRVYGRCGQASDYQY